MQHLPAGSFSDLTVLSAYIIFSASYLVFALGKFPGMKIDRPAMAIIGAVLMVAFRVVGPQDALHFIDFGTIVLLFSMMLIVSYLRLAGFFDWITERVADKLTPQNLLPTIILTTGLLSAFFVNDIICLVMVPFALNAARRACVKPLTYLLAVATAANIGSVATITGNPQNMLISSFSHITYRDFAYHLGPVALAGLFFDWLLLSLLCPPTAREEPVAEASLPPDVARTSFIKPGIVIFLVIIGFLTGAPPPLVAALGAAAILITRTRDPRHVYEGVDWGLLVFFIGLFLIVGGAETVGLTYRLLEFFQRWNLQHPAIFTLVVAGLSNLVSNVPAVMLLKSLVPGFSHPQTAWTVLAMVSTLAGNLTITGSVANIIVVERARTETTVSFWEYFRVGLPITLMTISFGLLWLWWTGGL